MPQLSDEFGTARNCNITPSKVGSYFNAILSKKEELNTLPDSGRKRQQINTKDNFWPATARSKSSIENWFKDLAGNKPLISLSKKVYFKIFCLNVSANKEGSHTVFGHYKQENLN